MAETQEEQQQQHHHHHPALHSPHNLPSSTKAADPVNDELDPTPIDDERKAAGAAAATNDLSVSAGTDSAEAVKPQSTAIDNDLGEKECEQEAVDLPNLDALSVSDGVTIDNPEIFVQADKLSEETEPPETEIKKVFAGDTPYSSAKTFEDLNLSETLLRGLYSEMKFEKASKIQAETLPMILTPPHANLIAQAHNCSGKTTCFVLGMLGRVDPQLKAPQALCVCPTRELAIQVLLFSATYNEKVKQFALRNIPKTNYVFVKKEELSLDVIKQYRVRCPNRNAKIEVLRDRIFPIAEKLGQSIIFVRTRESASELHRKLEADGHKCTSIQGGLSHEDRDRVIREFRSGNTKILIATDVLARGFDQAQVTLVVNYDLPVKSQYPYEPDYEVYLHRIGRSGQFGRKGAAFNLLVSEQDETNLNRIEKHFDRHVPEVPWEDDDAFEKVLKDAGLA